MSTTEKTIQTLLAHLTGAGDVRERKMFGEYILYCDNKVVALVCDDQLFVKATEPGQAFAPDLPLAPGYPGAKPGIHVSADKWQDTPWLTKLIRLTANALPTPKLKTPKKK